MNNGMKRLDEIQAALLSEGMDGWLLYDFRGLNPIALRVAGISPEQMLTRRWACFVPVRGAPRWLVHGIEAGGLGDLAPGALTYISWVEWREGLRELFAGARRVAMEVSPGAAIPTVSRVDAGTVELIRSLGVEVISSADLVQIAEAVWSAAQLDSHRRACRHLLDVKDATFQHVRERLAAGTGATEAGVQRFMAEQIAAQGLAADHPPIVAVNAHAADPHFAPNRDRDTEIRPGDLLLVDLWGRERDPDAIYGDITWMAFAGSDVPLRLASVFRVVRAARDAAVAFARSRIRAGELVCGFEVDQAARDVIVDAGLGASFIHRTGHSIGTAEHGNGVNLDNLETQDRRRLMPGVGFSVEPGVYLPEEGFGIRLEIDCYVAASDLEVTTLPLQDEMVLL